MGDLYIAPARCVGQRTPTRTRVALGGNGNQAEVRERGGKSEVSYVGSLFTCAEGGSLRFSRCELESRIYIRDLRFFDNSRRFVIGVAIVFQMRWFIGRIISIIWF